MSNFNNYKKFENVGIRSSNDTLIVMDSSNNNISLHSSDGGDDNVDTLSIKNIINKSQNEDLNLSSLNGTTINPVITINNNHSDCRIMTNLNVSGNVNIIGNGIINTSLGIGTTSLNNGFTSSNVHTNSILDINGQTTIRGHILPSQNAQFDLGNAEYKIRHLFLSDNSLWVGDNHKITIHGGKMKFRKRITSTLPSSITSIGGNENGIKTFLGVDQSTNLNTIKLNQLNNYMKHLSGDNNKTIDDVFRTTDSNDWEEESNVDNWLEKSDNI